MGNYQTVIKSVASLTSGDQTSRLFDNSFSPNGQNIFVGLANGVLHYWIEIYLKTIYEVKKVRMLYEYDIPFRALSRYVRMLFRPASAVKDLSKPVCSVGKGILE